MMPLHRQDVRIALALCCLLTCWYWLTTNGYIDSVDGEEVYHVTEGLVERHTFAQLEVAETGNIPRALVRGSDGNLYAITGPLQSLLGLPFYWAGHGLATFFPPLFKPYLTRFCVSLMNGLTGAAAAALLYLFGVDLGYHRRTALFLALTLALATIAWPYARVFFAESLLTFWLVLMAWAAYRYVHTGYWPWIAAAGMAMGLGIATKYIMVVAAPALGLYLFLEFQKRPDKLRWAGVTLLAAGLPMLLVGASLGWFNYARFHSILETGYTAPNTGGNISTWGKSASLWGSLYGFFLSAGKGFFFFSPPTLLCWWGWSALGRRRRAELWFFLSLAAIYPLFYSLLGSKNASFPVWVGGIAWGPRYLVCITPFLILPVGAFLERRDLARFWRVGGAGALFVAGFWVQASQLAVNYNSYLLGDTPLLRQLYAPGDAIWLAQWRRWPTQLRGWQAYDHAWRSAGSAFFTLEDGFYPVEVAELQPFGRWMQARGQVHLYAQPQHTLTLRVAYSRPRQADSAPWPGLQWQYDGLAFTAERHLVAELAHETQWQETLTLPAAQAQIWPGVLTLTAPTWTPENDARALSVFISRIEVWNDTTALPPQTAHLPRPLPITPAAPWNRQAMIWFYDLGNPRPADLWVWYVWTSGLPLPQARAFILTLTGILSLGLLSSGGMLIYTLKHGASDQED